jgi:SsuE family FMN reductase
MSLRIAGIAGSPTAPSRSRALVTRALSHLHQLDAEVALIDLAQLSAEGLLMRRKDAGVDDAIAQAIAADALVIGTPVYRATYSGQLKAFFDLFPQDALRGHAVGLIVTGHGDAHSLAADTGLRPLVASLRGLTAARSIYATNATFPDQSSIPERLDAELRELAEELFALAHALPPARAGVPVTP